VCIIIGKLLIPLPHAQPGEIFDLLSPFFGLFLAIGMYLRQRQESGVFGCAARILLFTGLVAVVSLDYFGAFMRLQLPEGTTERLMQGPSAPVFAGSLLIFLSGELPFGISVIRAGVFSKVASILFMAGMIPVALHLSGVFPESAVAAASVAAGIGLIWWGISLHRTAADEAALA
jgi:hypothetical protein